MVRRPVVLMLPLEHRTQRLNCCGACEGVGGALSRVFGDDIPEAAYLSPWK